MFLFHKNNTKWLCPSLYVLFGGEKVVCHVHSNIVLIVLGIKHFNLFIWSFLSFLLPLHYHLCFNKWHEKQTKVSEQTLRSSIPSYVCIHSGNIYWAQTKCQVGHQLLQTKRRKSRLPELKLVKHWAGMRRSRAFSYDAAQHSGSKQGL